MPPRRPRFSVGIENQALEMFGEHVEFLSRVSDRAAIKLIMSLKKVANNLALNPFIYPFADNLDVPNIIPITYRKCLFSERYKAIYYVEDNNVRIYVIIDTRRENKDISKAIL